MIARMSHDDELPAKPAPAAVLTADTSAEVERMQVALWRGMSPLEKAQVVGRISRMVRDLALAGIRQRHPAASEHECHLRYALLTLGRAAAARAYPEVDGLRGG
jgi:hypothetical protein